VAVLVLLVAAACSGSDGSTDAPGPRIAFLFDGSFPDADLVTAPALAGLELAAHEAGGVEIEPVNVGADRDDVMASLRELGDDRRVLAAIVAPWTAPPAGAIELIAADGVPVVTLSWAWGPPRERDVPWLSLVVGRAREAVMLLSGAAAAGPDDRGLCLAADDHATSRALLETAAELAEAAGDPQAVTAGVVDDEEAETADAVAARIRDARCPVMAWIGGTPAATSVLASIPDPPTVIGTSRMKTDDGLSIASSGGRVLTVCACADVALWTGPTTRRFVHDVQAESGAPPGPFALEAYDAGRLLVGLVRGADVSREGLARSLDGLTRFEGLVGSYAFAPDGSRVVDPAGAGTWRAGGSRWLPDPASGRPPVGAA
jgi:ABC-type branched-subunit amino acid transport system substrate-binding protein